MKAALAALAVLAAVVAAAVVFSSLKGQPVNWVYVIFLGVVLALASLVGDYRRGKKVDR